MSLVEMPRSEKTRTSDSRTKAADASSAGFVSRTTLNFWLDALLLAVFTALAAVGMVLRFVFPRPTQADGHTLWGYDYDQWSAAWFNLFAGFALLILVHVMLHWTWICGVAGRIGSRALGRTVRVDEAVQTVYGVGLLILLLSIVGAFTAAAVLSLQIPS
ncbi:MAG: DUF4405 domain-containing protein [Planctomycetales bacterium]|nr:DUF4405 domain-containing protein [Planctomycetales bacterium]MBN8628442.1 DUF4405 domain-containing protein [Planctomycetota bacterium]